MKTLGAAVARRFEDEMVAHLAEFSPPLFKAAGEGHIRQVIRLGISKAASHGFENRGPVRLYLEMMLLFGSYFDTDPQYRWAAEILTNRDVFQMQRAELLFARLRHYREAVAGPADAYTLEALRRIQVWAQQPLELTAETFLASVLEEITRVYPQKAVYAGAAALEALTREGVELARKHRFPMVRGVTLVIVLMLAFGHGCADDPLYPWISRTLNDEAITDPAARAKRLERKALTWLDHVLAYFDKSANA